MKLQIAIIFFLVILFSGCKNDLKLNAPYLEKPSIYAVLNPQDQIQMIRINKVFLGETDANAMAQIADSINYPAGELQVTLTRFVNGVQANASKNGSSVITFSETMIQAQPGAFNVNQRIYISNEPLFTNGEYRLTVFNTKTKNTFTAKANAIDSVKPLYRPFLYATYPAPPNTAVTEDNYIKYDEVGKLYTIRYAPTDAKVYQLVMRLHYFDSIGQNAPNELRYVDFPFTNQYEKDAGGNPRTLSVSFRGQDVYNAVAAGLSKNSKPVNEIIGRRMYKIEFFIYGSTQDYVDYLQFASPSLSLNQDKPLYSNFTDQAAIGIFTFRTRASVAKEMDNLFVSQFRSNQSTCGYKFFNADRSLKGCQ